MKLNFSQINRVVNGLNAVALFAYLGDTTQVMSLLKTGGTMADAVYGYALGGHVEKVDGLLKTHPELDLFAAKAYARVNNETEIEKRASSNDLGMKKALLEGYAQAGNEMQMYAAVRSREAKEYLLSIVTGLAEGAQSAVMNFATNETLQNTAITAAAYSGNVGLVNELLAQQGIILNQLSNPLKPKATLALGHALVGYSKGRHYEMVEPFLTLGINPMLCLTAITKHETIDSSDLQSLIMHVSKETHQRILLKLAKQYFDIELGEHRDDFSNDRELQHLFEGIDYTRSPSQVAF